MNISVSLKIGLVVMLLHLQRSLMAGSVVIFNYFNMKKLMKMFKWKSVPFTVKVYFHLHICVIFFNFIMLIERLW